MVIARIYSEGTSGDLQRTSLLSPPQKECLKEQTGLLISPGTGKAELEFPDALVVGDLLVWLPAALP